MPSAVMWVARNAKARPTAMPIAVWLVASSSSEALINADRFLGRTGLTSGMSVCLLTTAVEARIVWLDQFDCREDLRSRVNMPQCEQLVHSSLSLMSSAPFVQIMLR